MRDVSLWRDLLSLEYTVIEGVVFDRDERELVVAVRPAARHRSRCGRCRAPARGYDAGRGRRRALDFATVRVFLEADAPRVRCPVHGVVVAHVPWATIEHGLSNAISESTNTRIRLRNRIAFGIKDPDALISLLMLSLSGRAPALPGRT